jgi:hypothetical protein
VKAFIDTRSTTPVKLFPRRWQLNRDDLAGAVAVQGLERPVEAGALAIEAAQGDDAREAEAGRLFPRLSRSALDAVHGVHHDQGGFGHAERRARVAEEVGEPGVSMKLIWSSATRRGRGWRRGSAYGRSLRRRNR